MTWSPKVRRQPGFESRFSKACPARQVKVGIKVSDRLIPVERKFAVIVLGSTLSKEEMKKDSTLF